MNDECMIIDRYKETENVTMKKKKQSFLLYLESAE